MLLLKNLLQNNIAWRRCLSSGAPAQVLDKQQVAAMQKERCLLTDENDKVTGFATKEVCHLVQADGTLPLHRAFSVYLFNTRGDLLLQRRSKEKITYPNCYTNTCCSHPLHDVLGEDDENDALGVKKAAMRRLNYELGIPLEQLSIDKLKYLTRIHYFDIGNGKWGEHEIAYIFFMQSDVDLNPNLNEVNDISFIPHSHINTFVSSLESPLTPWFHLIYKHRLHLWWDSLDDLDQFVDHKNIIRFIQ